MDLYMPRVALYMLRCMTTHVVAAPPVGAHPLSEVCAVPYT